MYIFVDLDNTLFDTSRLGTDTSLLLEKELGISPEVYEKARKEMFATNNKIYSAKLHAEILSGMAGIDRETLVSKFINLFNNEESLKYVFSDSVEFLKSCKALGEVVILTYGEDFVQKPRAIKSGLSSLVDDVIITQKNKADSIAEYFAKSNISNDGKVALIDDSLEHLDNIKKRFPDAVTIHLVRNPKTETPVDHQRAESLVGALSILQKSLNWL